MSDEAMLRGATLGTGLSLIEARVDQYALGGLSYDNVARFLAELRDAGFEASPVAVGQFRLALIGAIREPDRATESAAEAAAILRTWIDASADDPAAAETLVSMLGVADALGVLNRPDLLAPDLVETASEAIAGRFANLSPESKYAASLIEVARTGVYGPALARLTEEVRRFSDGAGTADALGFEHERILARFTAELARTYQALEGDAYNRVRAFSEAYPDNAAAQLLFIDSLLRAGEVPPARTGPLTEALDRLRNTLGADSYTYNLAESRRLYANTETRTPDVARQEIISRLDRFVEGQQAGSAPVEVLVLVAKWWELLPNSLERRLGYLRRAQQTSPTAWGIYPDFIRALGEAGEWDEAAAALNVWARQLTPSLGLRSDRRDLAQFVGDRFNRIAAQAADSRSAEIQALLWSIAVEDAFVIAETTGTPSDRLRVAQVLVAAPDVADARDRALAILGLDELAATRVTESRPASIGRDEAVADLTVAAAVEYADQTLRDLPGDPGLSEETLPAVAGAAQLIAENHKLAEFTLDVASGRVTNFPATIAPEPRAEQARRALAQATRGTENDLASRAEALFYAFAYRPETWQDEADAARSAMLAASAIETLTETETQALVYPLSQLGEIDTAIDLQQRIADSEESGTDRIADVIAIAEILRDAGRTEDAYATLDTLSSQDRDRLTTSDIPPGPQALVALLELETGQQQTPVTSAFARRVIDQPRETRDALLLAITRANGSAPRLKLLNLISDDLAQLSESNPDGPEYRPFVAELWFSAATQAGESDPLRRELLTQTISRLNAVAQIDDDPERRVFAYQRKAYCEIELGSLDTGIRTYRQVLELEPNDPATLNNLADALKRRGQYPEALQTAERAVATSASSQLPDSVLSIFYNNLGGCHLAVGDTDSALVALRTSLDLDPSNAGARVTLAEAQLEAGVSLDTVRATIEPIGPAAEQALSSADRERLQAVRDQL
jgi:tetratricopeptide (TPR) repeat protein